MHKTGCCTCARRRGRWCFADRSKQSFSPDDRWVVYKSDDEKSDNVYLAGVQSN